MNKPLLEQLPKFSAVCREIEQRHPFPREVIQNQRHDRVKHFLLELRRCAPNKLERWIDTLPLAKLAFVFEGMASSVDQNTLNRLFLVVQRRAGWQLYAYGWLAMQQYFPNDHITRAFRLLCSQLDQKENLPRPNYLDNDVIEPVMHSADAAAFFELFSRHFEQMPASTFADIRIAYQFEPTHTLWLALTTQYFKLCSEENYYLGRKLLAEILPYTHPQQLEILLRRLIDATSLSKEQKQEIAIHILQKLPILTPVHPAWQEIQKNIRYYFHHIAVKSCLEQHYGANKFKETFYQPQLQHIIDIARISNQALAIRYPGFILVDHVQMPEMLYFYSNAAVEALLSDGMEQTDLAVPNLTMPIVGLDMHYEQALKEHLLRLYLVAPSSRQAQLFMNDFIQQQQKQRQQQKTTKRG